MSSSDAKIYYLYKVPQISSNTLMVNFYPVFNKLPLIISNRVCVNMANRINNIKNYLFPCYIKLNLENTSFLMCYKKAGRYDENMISYHIFFIFLKIIYLREAITFTDFSNKILSIERSDNILNSGVNNKNEIISDNDNYDNEYKDDNEYIKIKKNNRNNKELIHCYKKIHDMIGDIYNETNTDKKNDEFVKIMIKINKTEGINKTDLLIKIIDSMYYDTKFNINIIIEQINKRIINIIRTYN